MPAPVCPIRSQDLILQIRLNRGRSNGGESEIVATMGGGGDAGHHMPPDKQLGELFASSRNPGEFGVVDSTIVKSQVTHRNLIGNSLLNL